MPEAPTKSIKSTIQDVLNYIWATTGNITPDKFKIGVDWDEWTDLGGSPKMASVKFQVREQTFMVIPLPGLPKGSVALIWQ